MADSSERPASFRIRESVKMQANLPPDVKNIGQIQRDIPIATTWRSAESELPRWGRRELAILLCLSLLPLTLASKQPYLTLFNSNLEVVSFFPSFQVQSSVT